MELKGILSAKQIDDLSTIYLVFLTPSVIGSFSVLVVSIIRWKQLKEQVHLLVQLALVDLLAALILMFTSGMNKVSTYNSATLCQYGLPLSLTFYFISFLLVVVYAWKSRSAIQGWRANTTTDEGAQSPRRRKIADISVYAMVWLIPAALYFVHVHNLLVLAPDKTNMVPVTDRHSPIAELTNRTAYCSSCLLFLHMWTDPCSQSDEKYEIAVGVFLIVVVISVILSCSVIYYKVGKWYQRHEEKSLLPVEGRTRSFSKMFSTARNMVMVILFCWMPALVLILLSALMIKPHFEQRSLFVLYAIQAATVSLQGFLNSMVYAWRRPNFTEAILGERTPLVAHHRQAFFEESLTS